jgi:hypothetical protein
MRLINAELENPYKSICPLSACFLGRAVTRLAMRSLVTGGLDGDAMNADTARSLVVRTVAILGAVPLEPRCP